MYGEVYVYRRGREGDECRMDEDSGDVEVLVGTLRWCREHFRRILKVQ